MIPRKELRTKYVPNMTINFKNSNSNIKLHILDIFVYILTNIPDFHTRQQIHHFLNEELAKSKSIYDRRMFITFCAKICPKISKKYFKEVFAFSMLKIIEEKKKDIAIYFSK